MPFGIAVFDRQVLSLDIAVLPQSLTECGQEWGNWAGKSGVEQADHRHRLLLRAQGERPRSRRTGENGNSLASSHPSPPIGLAWAAPRLSHCALACRFASAPTLTLGSRAG